jgi:predicted short-subunit dehydrogenase-like oxidoreductase (DUF2520 family)
VKNARKDKTWNVVLIGAGSAAVGMLRGFTAAEIPVVAVGCRSKSAGKALLEKAGGGEVQLFTENAPAARLGNLVVLAVPDKAVTDVVSEIARNEGFEAGALVVHLSGALSSRALDPARASGARIGSLHPLLSFTGDGPAAAFAETTFTIEGDDDVLADLRDLVQRLGAVPVAISADQKALYHAAAAIVSNYTVGIFDMGSTLFEKIGIPREAGQQGLQALLQSTLGNIERGGVPQALTGPIARGDTKTVEGHLKALKESCPDLLSIYAALGSYTIDVARRKGTLAPDEAEIMRMMFARHL